LPCFGKEAIEARAKKGDLKPEQLAEKMVAAAYKAC
jgi:hypothetical protein